MTTYSVTPDILSAAVSFFNGGAAFPAGDYTISYQGGSFEIAPQAAPGWCVNYDSAHTYMVTDGAGNLLAGPGLQGVYSTQAQCQSASTGQSVVYHHAGGEIGMYLLDTTYTDNIAGAPNPTFSISAVLTVPPAIAIPSLTATPSLPGNVPSIILTGM